MGNVVYIATSLDGYIATKSGDLDWLMQVPNPSGTDFGYAQFVQRIDAIVMGRNTFEKVVTLVESWPYTHPVFVLSRSLKELPDSVPDNVELIHAEAKELVEQLHQRGHENLYIDGGRVIQHFLEEDLIDEMIITRVPILLGSGYPLFGENNQMLKFRFEGHEVYNGSLVKSRYIRDRSP